MIHIIKIGKEKIKINTSLNVCLIYQNQTNKDIFDAFNSDSNLEGASDVGDVCLDAFKNIELSKGFSEKDFFEVAKKSFKKSQNRKIPSTKELLERVEVVWAFLKNANKNFYETPGEMIEDYELKNKTLPVQKIFKECKIKFFDGLEGLETETSNKPNVIKKSEIKKKK